MDIAVPRRRGVRWWAAAMLARSWPLRAAPILAASLLASQAFWDRPEPLFTSDTLALSEFVWDVLRRPAAWFTFQQPHSPEFVPADAVLAAFQAATGDWRAAMAGWTFVAILWLMLAAQGIGTRWRGGAKGAGAWPVAAGIGLVLLAAASDLPADASPAATGGLFFPWALILMPGQHGGTFLLSLGGALILADALKRPSMARFVGIALLAFAAMLSDLLSLVFFLVPATAALAGCVAGRPVAPRVAVRMLLCLWGGGIWGGLSATRIERQWMPSPTLASALSHGPRFLTDLPANPGLAMALLGSIGVAVLVARRRGVRRALADFWPIFAAASGLGALAVTAILYEDAWTARYAAPLLWWPIVFGTALLPAPYRGAWGRWAGGQGVRAPWPWGRRVPGRWARWVRGRGQITAPVGARSPPAVMVCEGAPSRSLSRQAPQDMDRAPSRTMTAGGGRAPRDSLVCPLVPMGLGAGGLGALALGGAACAWLALGQPMPRMLGWSSPLASCLEREGLHAGLADYWIARRTSAASDWRVQIEPLDANGAARVWGNDWSWFAHATLDPSRRPAYRFIVTDRLPLATIGSVYGAPDRVATCAGATIWVYDDPNRLFDSLAHASPFLADTFATAPAGP